MSIERQQFGMIVSLRFEYRFSDVIDVVRLESSSVMGRLILGVGFDDDIRYVFLRSVRVAI